MNIAFICYTYFGNIGGLEHVTKRVVDALRKEHKVTVIVSKHTGKTFDNGNAIELESKGNYAYMPKLLPTLNKHNFDACVTVGFGKYYLDVVGRWCKKNNKVSISIPIGYFHTNSNKVLKFIYGSFIARSSLSKYDAIVTATKQEAEFWKNKYNLSKEKLIVIPHSIDSKFNNYKKTGITKKTGKNFILYVGRNGPNKRIDLLIKAFSEVKTKSKLVIAGFGTKNENFSNLTKSLNLENKIIFLGEVSENEKKELLDNAKLCVFPSDYETFGLVILEAAAFNTPIIGSDIPAFREVIGDKSRLFKNTPKSIANCIKKSLKSKIKNKGYEKDTEKEYLLLIDKIYAGKHEIRSK